MCEVCVCVCVCEMGLRVRLGEPGTSSQRVLEANWRVWTSACALEKAITRLSPQSLQKAFPGPKDPVKGPRVLPPVPFVMSPVVCNLYGGPFFPYCCHEALSFLKEEGCLFVSIPQHPAQGSCIRPHVDLGGMVHPRWGKCSQVGSHKRDLDPGNHKDKSSVVQVRGEEA